MAYKYILTDKLITISEINDFHVFQNNKINKILTNEFIKNDITSSSFEINLREFYKTDIIKFLYRKSLFYQKIFNDIYNKINSFENLNTENILVFLYLYSSNYLINIFLYLELNINDNIEYYNNNKELYNNLYILFNDYNFNDLIINAKNLIIFINYYNIVYFKRLNSINISYLHDDYIDYFSNDKLQKKGKNKELIIQNIIKLFNDNNIYTSLSNIKNHYNDFFYNKIDFNNSNITKLNNKFIDNIIYPNNYSNTTIISDNNLTTFLNLKNIFNIKKEYNNTNTNSNTTDSSPLHGQHAPPISSSQLSIPSSSQIVIPPPPPLPLLDNFSLESLESLSSNTGVQINPLELSPLPSFSSNNNSFSNIIPPLSVPNSPDKSIKLTYSPSVTPLYNSKTPVYIPPSDNTDNTDNKRKRSNSPSQDKNGKGKEPKYKGGTLTLIKDFIKGSNEYLELYISANKLNINKLLTNDTIKINKQTASYYFEFDISTISQKIKNNSFNIYFIHKKYLFYNKLFNDILDKKINININFTDENKKVYLYLYCVYYLFSILLFIEFNKEHNIRSYNSELYNKLYDLFNKISFNNLIIKAKNLIIFINYYNVRFLNRTNKIDLTYVHNKLLSNYKFKKSEYDIIFYKLFNDNNIYTSEPNIDSTLNHTFNFYVDFFNLDNKKINEIIKLNLDIDAFVYPNNYYDSTLTNGTPDERYKKLLHIFTFKSTDTDVSKKQEKSHKSSDSSDKIKVSNIINNMNIPVQNSLPEHQSPFKNTNLQLKQYPSTTSMPPPPPRRPSILSSPTSPEIIPPTTPSISSPKHSTSSSNSTMSNTRKKKTVLVSTTDQPPPKKNKKK
tara:strand:- start:4110 stop:6638 length:2529 start_codon:yes stop_codon:yes gene_type:complete